jgi:hypothetical protein
MANLQRQVKHYEFTSYLKFDTNSVFDDTAMAKFFSTGFAVLEQIVSPPLISKAKKIANYWLTTKPASVFRVRL